MHKIQNVTSVPPTQVMIRNQLEKEQEQAQGRRRLEEYLLGDYYGSIDGYETVDIKDAVEIVLVRS